LTQGTSARHKNYFSEPGICRHVSTNRSTIADLSPLIATPATTGIEIDGASGTTRNSCARAESAAISASPAIA
jgi:hypothetical protein